MQRRSLLIVVCSVAACFSPEVSTDTQAGESETSDTSTDTDISSGSTEGGSGSVGSSTNSTGADPETAATDTEDETGSDDAAPTVESFTVNGSTRPAEVDEGGVLKLEAEVTDDVGVSLVEFFDGSTSLGIVDTPPYELDVVVSSADSGQHSYVAIATDTIDQTTQSDEVTLSINIVGGEVLFYRDNLFPGSTGLGGPGLAIASMSSGRVVVNGLVASTAMGRVHAFNEDLSSLWTDNGAGLTRARAGDLDGQILISTWEDGTWTYALRSLDSSSIEDTLTVGVPLGDITVQLVGSRGTTGGDGLVLTTLPNILASYSTAFAGPTWTLELADDAVISDLDPFPDGATLLTFSTDGECAPAAQTCLRRVEPNGAVAWTVGLDSSVVATTRASGAAAAVGTRIAGGISYIQIDADGVKVGPPLILDEGTDYLELADVAADGGGGIVFAATLGPTNNRSAIVSRYDESGDPIWAQNELATAPDSMGLGVSVFEDAAFVCGIEELETAGLSTNGDVFAAKLRL